MIWFTTHEHFLSGIFYNSLKVILILLSAVTNITEVEHSATCDPLSTLPFVITSEIFVLTALH